MEYVLSGKETESVVLSLAAVRRLVGSGNGDAALVYLALLAAGKGDGETTRTRLGWDTGRMEGALRALETLDLVKKAGAAPAMEEDARELQPGTQRQEYTRADLARALEGKDFAALTAAVEQTLGKKLTTPDLAMLLGLQDNVGLPGDVIFLLVNYCTERWMDRYGIGRKPTMRQIEQEGYAWARRGLMEQESASAYIRLQNRRRESLPRMMKILGLGERKPSATEERYMLAWSDMGFEDGVIDLAYDKTILKCKELKWPYMNKILTSWKEKGLTTLTAIEAGDRLRRPKQAGPSEPSDQEAMEEMQKVLLRMKGESGRGGK